MERNGAAREAIGIETAERRIGIGDGGLGTATAVARRAGNAAGGVGADLEATQRIQSRNRAAAGADFDKFDDGNAHRQAGALNEAIGTRDLELARPLQLQVVEQGELGGRAAHVEGNGLAGIVLRGDCARQDSAAGGTGFDQPHGIAPCGLDGGDAARRHHEQQRSGDALALEVGFAGDEPNTDVAAAITTAAARLLTNPSQVPYDVGSVSYRGGFNGWTLTERLVLNRYRIKAQ